MLRKIEKSAKSKEEALQLAAEEFGVPVSELSYTVEREVGKGIMGLLLGKEVIISAWVTAEEEAERKIRETAKERAKSESITDDSNPYAPKTEPHTHDYVEKGRKKKPSRPLVKEESAETPATTDTAPTDAETAEQQQSAPRPARRHHEVTEKSVEDAKYFATELIHRIGLADANVEAVNAGDCVKVDVSGEKMGLLIGKRGDTLDAVQYLTSLYVNKAKNSYIKVSIDTENYRAKREETLVKLAKSLERRVIRDGEAVTLEPMSPNERRIIHSTLQNSSRVKTYSVGDDPHRKVVVAPNK